MTVRTDASARVYLIDSHDIFLTGMRLVLGDDPRVSVIGAVTDSTAAVRDRSLTEAGVVVLGVLPHQRDVAEQVSRVRRVHPRAAVVVLTRRREDHPIALRAGATAVLTREIDADRLRMHIAAAAAGRRPAPLPPARDTGVSPDETAPSADGPRSETGHDAGISRLTPQERRVLALIAEGLSNRDIGEQLFLAEKTVRNHVTGLLHKLGVSRRTQAALIAVRTGVVRDEPDSPRS